MKNERRSEGADRVPSVSLADRRRSGSHSLLPLLPLKRPRDPNCPNHALNPSQKSGQAEVAAVIGINQESIALSVDQGGGIKASSASHKASASVVETVEEPPRG